MFAIKYYHRFLSQFWAQVPKQRIRQCKPDILKLCSVGFVFFVVFFKKEMRRQLFCSDFSCDQFITLQQTFAIASWQDIQQTSRRALGITQPRIPFMGSSSNRAQLDTSFYSTQYCLQRLIKHVLWNNSSNKESSFQEAICNYNLPRNSVQVLSLWETEKQRRRCHCLDQSEAYWLGGLVRTILNTRTLHNCFKFHMCTKMHDERDTTQFVVILHHPETPSHFRTCS